MNKSKRVKWTGSQRQAIEADAKTRILEDNERRSNNFRSKKMFNSAELVERYLF